MEKLIKHLWKVFLENTTLCFIPYLVSDGLNQECSSWDIRLCWILVFLEQIKFCLLASLVWTFLLQCKMLQGACKCCLHFLVCTTRGQWIHHCNHHHFHLTAGHPGQCAVLHVQEGQAPVRALREARSVGFLFL